MNISPYNTRMCFIILQVENLLTSESTIRWLVFLIARIIIFAAVTFLPAAPSIVARVQALGFETMQRVGGAWAEAIEKINAALESGQCESTPDGAVNPPLKFNFPILPGFPSVAQDPGYRTRMRTLGVLFGAATVFSIYFVSVALFTLFITFFHRVLSLEGGGGHFYHLPNAFLNF